MINRSLNILIVLLVLLVVGIETHTYWFYQLRPWQPSTSMGRLIFYYSFFTVLTNLMLAASCLTLAIKPTCSSTFFSVIRLNGLVGVLITIIIYNILLRGVHRPPTLLLQLANESLHVVIPILGLLTWLIYGPFARITLKIVLYSFCSFLLYAIYIFVRGHITGQYPYPFINVSKIGYEKALIAAGLIAMLFFVLVGFLKIIAIIRLRIIK
ncbi:Pr6Pr family membrane protein [Orbus mooreae]|uniref:Pr6Pr family membrane protein n=1 Tax=Orbus mooreae TaxID=3074107 RepID=UPI00370D6520